MTPIVPVRIDVRGEPRFVYLKLEAFGPWGSIKDRTARSLVFSLEAEGRLHPGATIVESTSGNLGVALASLARTRGYRLVAVVDPKVSTACLRAMRALGARIELVDSADRDGSYLGARLARVRELCEASSALVWPDQYTNPANPRAHELGTGREIVEQTGGRVDAVVVAVSTGGTLAGVSACLRAARPDAFIVGVDAVGSVALGGPAGPRRLTGIGSSRPSAFLEPEMLDASIRVSDAEAFAWCRALAGSSGIRLGGSGGAVLAVCADLLSRRPDLRVPVCVCADGGSNYADTIYDDDWLRAQGLGELPGSSAPVAPAPVVR